MRSIYGKILLWSLATFALSIAAFAAISYDLATRSPGPGDFFSKALALIEDESIRAYEDGGTARLSAYLRRLDAHFQARHVMTDADGRDLLTGEDWSTLPAEPTSRPRRLDGGKMVLVRRSADGRYGFLIFVTPAFDPLGVLPYFGAVVLAIALLGYALAVHLAGPLRGLRQVVDRFGGGDLEARADSRRRDEIGELSRAFDAMAGQIQTLRTAELRLLQDVSHELRSPLARLGFNLELARSVEDPAVPFGRIKADLDRLGNLVGELLQLTCAEGDPASRVLEAIAVADLLGAIVEENAAEAQARGCGLDLRIQNEANLLGDRELLRRALENVLRNAIRHAPEGSTIDVRSTLADGLATITIRDRGPGVPDSALDAIFEPFFRVGDARSRSDGGVGLGLSIARRSIELHQGRIKARNAHPGLAIVIEIPASAEVPTSSRD